MAVSRVLRAALLVALAGSAGASTAIDEGQAGASGERATLHSRSYYFEEFRTWMYKNAVTFGNEGEFEYRLQVFTENSDLIETHNNANDGATFTLAHNEFSHLSWEEFRESHMGYNRVSGSRPAFGLKTKTKATSRRQLIHVPNEVDWAVDGAVTPIQNQGMCGSCWAFSAIGAMEGAFFMETQELTKFSEEQLVDCDKIDKGCFGGDMGQAFDWIKDNGGVCAENDYPYTGLWPPFRTCATTCNIVEGTEVKEWAQVDATDEALMAALARVGPIAIAIEADQMAFQFYSSGVFTSPCGDKLDHGVLVVGYGTSDDGVDYWKVKNSWGETWGLGGFILLERADSEEDVGGECGLLIEAVYPVLGTPDETPAKPLAAAEVVAVIAQAWEIERPVGFESSAAASDCGGGNSDVVFDSISITPASPKRGEAVTMIASGTLTKPLSSGSYALAVKLGSSEVYTHDGSICGDSSAKLPLGLGTIKLHGLPCPAAPGPVTFSLEVKLPSIAPPGDYDISLVGSEANASSALCLDVKLSL